MPEKWYASLKDPNGRELHVFDPQEAMPLHVFLAKLSSFVISVSPSGTAFVEILTRPLNE